MVGRVTAAGARGAREQGLGEESGLASQSTLHKEGMMGGAMTTGLFTGMGRGAALPAPMTVRALQAFVDRWVETSQRAYKHAMRRRAVRLEAHRFTRDHQLDKACSTTYAADAPAMTFVRQLVRLWRAGSTLAELTQLAEVPLRAVIDLAGGSLRALDHIDLEEQRLDGEEDMLQLRRRIHPLTAPGLRDEADVCVRAAAVYQERAAALRAEAVRVESRRGMVA